MFLNSLAFEYMCPALFVVDKDICGDDVHPPVLQQSRPISTKKGK
jgi:hypothetical protein